MTRISALLIFSIVILGIVCPAVAQNYTIDTYDFRWEIGRAGKTALYVQKTQIGVGAILSSPGGRLGSINLTPSQAKAVGDLLLKTDDYYAEFQAKTMESGKTVPAGDVFVTFSSKRKGANFKVAAHPEKIIKNAVLFNREEALKMGKLLQDIEARAAFADKRIQP